MPPKTTNGANKAKAVVAKLVKRHLSYSLREQEIVDCSYLGKTNSIVVKFSKVGKGSDHENIISQCRDIGFLHFSKGVDKLSFFTQGPDNCQNYG